MALLALVQLLHVHCQCQPASAQMTADLMHASPPDWSSWRVVMMLTISIPMLLLNLAVLFLLYRRRHLYPIASRGSVVLLVVAANTFVGLLFGTSAFIAYPRGLPCGIHSLALWLFFPLAVALLSRGWKLIFRLEIENYLTELAWRQSKIAQLHESGLAKTDGGSNADECARPGASTTYAAASVLSASGTLARAESDTPGRFTQSEPTGAPVVARAANGPLALPTLDPITIPGHGFITRRFLTEPRWMLLFASAATASAATLVTVISVWDADLTFADEWRNARGLPDDGIDSHYADGAFWTGPRCFPYSIKVSKQKSAPGEERQSPNDWV